MAGAVDQECAVLQNNDPGNARDQEGAEGFYCFARIFPIAASSL
ncbi:MAG TPA: hypothetical protein VJ248_10090 [Candidatus Udaeobacter sp.]|nr:hypothetical protein [Candidatus Udaeobacter sp.]